MESQHAGQSPGPAGLSVTSADWGWNQAYSKASSAAEEGLNSLSIQNVAIKVKVTSTQHKNTQDLESVLRGFKSSHIKFAAETHIQDLRGERT